MLSAVLVLRAKVVRGADARVSGDGGAAGGCGARDGSEGMGTDSRGWI